MFEQMTKVTCDNPFHEHESLEKARECTILAEQQTATKNPDVRCKGRDSKTSRCCQRVLHRVEERHWFGGRQVSL